MRNPAVCGSGVDGAWDEHRSTLVGMPSCLPIYCSKLCIPHSQWCIGVLLPPHLQQHLVLKDFLFLLIGWVLQWYLIVVLICITNLVTDEVKRLLICLLAILDFLFYEVTIQVFYPFFCWIIYLSLMICRFNLCIFGYKFFMD